MVVIIVLFKAKPVATIEIDSLTHLEMEEASVKITDARLSDEFKYQISTAPALFGKYISFDDSFSSAFTSIADLEHTLSHFPSGWSYRLSPLNIPDGKLQLPDDYDPETTQL